MTTRGELTHDLLETSFGDLDEAYKPTHPSTRCEERCSTCDHTEICSGAKLQNDTKRIIVGCAGDSCRQGRAECRSGCNVVPLKAARIQVGDRAKEISSWRKSISLPAEPPVLTVRVPRPAPASCEPISSLGVKVGMVLGIGTIACIFAGYICGVFQ